MAVYDWSNSVTKWYFNPDNVRDPTIVYNNTGIPVGTAPGYDGTVYAFQPINFAPNLNVPKPYSWTTIKLDQFGVSANAKEAILTGNCGITGPNMWRGVIYMWFRRPGSSWDLSPIFDGGYEGSFSVHVPVGLVDGVAAIEMAWGTNLLTFPADNAWLNAILSGWGEGETQ